MTILLLAIGSAGDVHPFVGVGIALKNRGHRVKVITNPFFGELITKAGLEFVPLGTEEAFDAVRKNPDLWHTTRGFKTIAELVSAGMRETYDAVMNNYEPGETVVAASSLGLAARVAQDKHGIPLATVHLAPAVFRSAIAPPKLPGLYMPAWLPVGCKRLLYGLGDRLLIDPLMAPAVNQLRADLGLPPVRGILKDWWNSPQRVIGLFPEWFAKPANDWPPQTRLTGFPLYDEGDICNVPPELDKFLKEGEPPIIFTPGSAMWHAHDIFRESVKATIRLNRRAILLSGHPGHIPSNLPQTIKAFPYAPFSQILPRCAALVHHGGIGTAAQAMAAGIKQLITPFAHDQFDNADRMQRLGVAKVIIPKHYCAKTVEKVLGDMLSDVAMEARCREVARKFIGINPIDQTCELIEALGARQPNAVPQ